MKKALETYIKSHIGDKFYGKSFVDENGKLFLWHSAALHEVIKFVKKKKI